MPKSSEKDVSIVAGIAAVPTILDVVCRTTGMRFAAVARVTEDRWIACEVLDTLGFGLKPGGELKVETTICNEIRQSGREVVIDHVAADACFVNHPTPAMYGFQSYISIPIVLSDGAFFGTLCAIDPKPAKLNTPQIIGMFRLFAELIAHHIDAATRLSATQQSLLDEQRTAELREQFIAVLGHDLRNPLAAMASGVRLLERADNLDDKQRWILRHLHSTMQRANALVDSIMDFARGRLGGGLTLNIEKDRPLEPTLMQVIAEMRTAWPDRRIELDIDVARNVAVDHQRIGQLLSNLLGNAVTHGAADHPIRVRARTAEAGLDLSVANSGEPIPANAVERLFKPFHRGDGSAGVQGLGLGLFIAAEIARGHGGRIDVDSSTRETRFTLRIPG